LFHSIPAKRLALHVAHVGRNVERRDPLVERVGFGLARVERRIERRSERRIVDLARAQPQAHGHRLAGTDRERVVRRRLAADVPGIHGLVVAVHEIFVERVLHVRLRVGRVPQALRVRLVLGEEHFLRRLAVQRIRRAACGGRRAAR
jgi:hypothetical protein